MINSEDGVEEGLLQPSYNHRKNRQLLGVALMVCVIGISVATTALVVSSQKAARLDDKLERHLKGNLMFPTLTSNKKSNLSEIDTSRRRLSVDSKRQLKPQYNQHNAAHTIPRDPKLTNVGNPGGALLGECEGSCVDDEDCEGSLVCYQRWQQESVPGCIGEGILEMNYCCNRPSNYLFYVDNVGPSGLGPCEGDCDTDDECADDLVCGERDGYNKVPGCDGMGRKNSEYCHYPTDRAPELETVVDQPSEGALLGKCEGDCNHDDDCEGSLVCYHRGGTESVPGCSGEGIARKDYCCDRPDDYLFFYGRKPTNHFPLKLCEGDCDSDDDCASNLVCGQRNGYDVVPGCRGMGRKNADYCQNREVQLDVEIEASAAIDLAPNVTPPPTNKPTTFPTTSHCYYVKIRLFFDSKPEETKWEMARYADNINSIIFSAGPFPSGQRTYFRELCLGIGDYKFTIYDLGNDGMGNGNYTVSTHNKEIIAQGGSFVSKETTAFPMPTLEMIASRL
mmetsp:Transcript_24032/g.41177  ORF Transcript_24032/g.41177 Transcript_24032/m.41177 type:complete len:507 (+) Transcript_24032:325-1845(+)